MVLVQDSHRSPFCSNYVDKTHSSPTSVPCQSTAAATCISLCVSTPTTTCPCFGLCMPGSFGVRFALRALAEPAAGQDSNGMRRRHLALLGSQTGEARASVGTAPSSRHIRGMTWRRSLCGSGYRSGPVNRSAGQDAATRSRLAGYGSVPVAAKPADVILTVRVEHEEASLAFQHCLECALRAFGRAGGVVALSRDRRFRTAH